MAATILSLRPHEDDALSEAKEELRSAHGHAGWELELAHAQDLPPAALGLARLACMSEEELYCASSRRSAAPPVVRAPAAVEFVSASNERLALLLVADRLDARAHAGPLRDLHARLHAFICGGGAPAPPEPPAAAAAGAQLDELASALRITHAVRLVDTAGAGRGLVAARPLAAGEAALSIPLAELVSVRAACAAEPWLRAPLDAIDEGVWTEQLRLMVVVLRERRRSAASRWAAWLESLPPTFGDCAQWEARHCGALPAALYWVRHALLAELDEFAERLLPELCAAHPRLLPAGAPSAAEWRWARGVVATRAIALDLSGAPGADTEAEPAIVPLADMLNHSPRAQLRLAVADGSLELRALTPIAAAAPLFLDYGSRLGAAELLLQHGIGPGLVEGRPVVAAVQLPAERVEGACVAAALLLARLSPGGAEWHYLTEAEPLPRALLLAARIACLRESEVRAAGRVLEGGPVSAANDREALLLLRESVGALLEPADPYGMAEEAGGDELAPEAAAAAGVEQDPAGAASAADAAGSAAARAIDAYCAAYARLCTASLAQIDAMLGELGA